MNREHITLGIVALACLAAVGTSASTLSSSVGTDPEDAVDPNYETLPVESDDVAEIRDVIDSEAEGGDATVPRVATEGDPATQRRESGGQDDEARGTVDGPGDRTGPSDEGQGTPRGGVEQDDDADGTGGGSLTDAVRGVLALLGDAIDSLLSNLLWAALLVGTVALAVRYRGLLGDSATAATDGGPGRWDGLALSDPPRDENVVYAAWDALVRDVGVADPDAVTPGQCARIAARRGRDEAAVEELRRAFEAVRYGDGEVTAERRETVERACERLGVRPGGGRP